MQKTGLILICIATVSLAAALLGCAASTSTDPSAESEGVSGGEQAQHGGHEHEAHGAHAGGHGDHEHGTQTDMETMKVELAKLSAEDRASAEQQHFCPVSGEMLGTMGPPKKIDVSGQQVWICCDACKEALLDNPEEYLAKLNK